MSDRANLFWQTKDFKNNIFIACDFFKVKDFYNFIKIFPFKPRLKIGYLLFACSGLGLIKKLISQGYEIFLDLKLCDTESTILNLAVLLKDLKIKWITIHPWTGKKAFQCLKTHLKNCNLTIVPVLTTISPTEYKKLWNSELNLIDFSKNLIKYNLKYCDAVVCSINESLKIKSQFPHLKTICPGGILSNHKPNYIHARSALVSAAHSKNNVDYLVIGRSIISSKDPLKTYQKFYEEFNK